MPPILSLESLEGRMDDSYNIVGCWLVLYVYNMLCYVVEVEILPISF